MSNNDIVNSEQGMLIEGLERSCKLAKQTDYDLYFASMLAIKYSPKAQHSVQVLRRLLRCIWDVEDLNPMVADLCAICYEYGLSLRDNEEDGIGLFLEEATKIAPEKLTESKVFFGNEVFRGVLNFLAQDRWYPILMPHFIHAYNTLSDIQKNIIIDFLSECAEKAAKSEMQPQENTKPGIILKRIQDAT